MTQLIIKTIMRIIEIMISHNLETTTTITINYYHNHHITITEIKQQNI
jgi:hypothetical protein